MTLVVCIVESPAEDENFSGRETFYSDHATYSGTTLAYDWYIGRFCGGWAMGKLRRAFYQIVVTLSARLSYVKRKFSERTRAHGPRVKPALKSPSTLRSSEGFVPCHFSDHFHLSSLMKLFSRLV